METKLRGFYKIYRDPKYAAINILDDDTAILFEGKDGRYSLDPTIGKLDDVSESASFIKVNKDATLVEANDAFLEKRLPRWKK
ncbi:MAG: hypothetical protein RLZZ479_909 [Bacteroidota bacterium]|jgi:hypothetical protein